MVSCVGVADSWRILARLSINAETISSVGASVTVCTTASSVTCVRLIVAPQHQGVEVEPDLADGGVHLVYLVGAGPGCFVGGWEAWILNVGDVPGNCCSAVTCLVDAAN